MNQIVEMQTYIAIVEAGSITEASKRIGTTKSVISQRMQQLEARLGVSLINRGRVLTLTEAGQEFYQRSIRLLTELNDLEESVKSIHFSLTGRLRLAVPMAFSINYLAPYLAEFMKLHPDLHLDVESTDNFVSLHEENYDVAIRMGQLSDSDLISKRITANHHYICASPDYLREFGTPEHPDELNHHDGLLYMARESHGMLQLPVNGEYQSFRIRTAMRTDSAHQLLEAAKAGLGLAILPGFIAAPAICDQSLKVVLPEFCPSGGDISVVYKRSLRASPKIHAISNFLIEKIGNPPKWEIDIAKVLAINSNH
ncbi:LysR family transcriptional regulator [Acinetobacter sp. V2]|uniref:LysR family transcriptional regulator n=1 Tax=Acinetobacter sp. V2 TaxID=1051623 RepID=UPI00061ECDB1|nr:LysR family transcriptional regulator [Acinetobacter sp. V2]KKC45488.1 LysR family transcriptional regulator [Acinetobacter sp. V2]